LNGLLDTQPAYTARDRQRFSLSSLILTRKIVVPYCRLSPIAALLLPLLLPLVAIDRKREGRCLWLRLEQSAHCNIDVIRGV